MSAQRAVVTAEELASRVGQEVGISPWREITQAEIDRFADLTGDDQFIHVDPARARTETPFGGTIAHGFLTLSLLSAFARGALPAVAERGMGVNYGFDRIRFVSPVPSGCRARGRFVLASYDRRASRQLLLRWSVTVEVEGATKPALTAEWLSLVVLR